MFTRCLSGLTLAQGIANAAFDNIRGSSYNSDVSFLATLRALLLPRVGDETVKMRLRNTDYNRRTTEQHNATELFSDFASTDLTIFDVYSTNSSDRDALFECLDSPERGFVVGRPEFEELTNIRDFVSNAMRARFYSSMELKKTVIVVEMLNVRKWHYIQSFIPRYFKWFFNENPITEEEKNLLLCLTKRSHEEYVKAIEEITQKFNLRDLMIDKIVGDIERRSRQAQIDRIDRSIEEAREQMENSIAIYRDYLNQFDDLNIRRLGLMESINSASGNNELADYFKSNKLLDPISSDGSRLDFIVKTYLDGFDPDMYDRMIRRPDSHLFTDYSVYNDVFRSKSSRKKFLDAIFADDAKFRVKICAYYRIDIRGTVDSARHYDYPENCADRLPNPHLYFHDCLGSHQRIIQDRLRAGDYIGAIDQCISSAKSINLSEHATVPHFLEQLFGSNQKVIELPDGSSATPADAYKWLCEQEESHNTEVSENAEAD